MDRYLNGYALLIGTASEDAIEATANDAQEIGILLKKQLLFPSQNVREHFRHTADKKGIVDGFNWLAESSDADAFVIIFYAGHGAPANEHCPEFHLRPYNYNERDSASLLKKSEFEELFNKITSRKLVLFLNCCYADGIASLGKPEADGFEELRRDLDTGRGRVIVSAARSDQLSYLLPGATHTLFGQKLLEGLKGDGSQGKEHITLPDVINHLQSVSVEAKKHGKDQSIRYSANIEGNFILAPGPKTPSLAQPKADPKPGTAADRTKWDVKHRLEDYIRSLRAELVMQRDYPSSPGIKRIDNFRVRILSDLNEYKDLLGFPYVTEKKIYLYDLDDNGRNEFWSNSGEWKDMDNKKTQ